MSGLLAGLGIASIARNASKPHRPLAAIPLLFAAQQAAEGVVWLAMGNSDQALFSQFAVSIFLGFALIIWPIWVPFSLQRVEHDPNRRRVLTVLVCAGVAVAAYATLLLTRWHPLPQIAGHSIRYVYSAGPDAFAPGVYLAAYAIPAVAPFFVSSASLMRTIGTALVASLALTFIVERDALTSVWCFFAAILSGLVLAAVIQEQRRLAFAVPTAMRLP